MESLLPQLNKQIEARIDEHAQQFETQIQQLRVMTHRMTEGPTTEASMMISHDTRSFDEFRFEQMQEQLVESTMPKLFKQIDTHINEQTQQLQAAVQKATEAATHNPRHFDEHRFEQMQEQVVESITPMMFQHIDTRINEQAQKIQIRERKNIEEAIEIFVPTLVQTITEKLHATVTLLTEKFAALQSVVAKTTLISEENIAMLIQSHTFERYISHAIGTAIAQNSAEVMETVLAVCNQEDSDWQWRSYYEGNSGIRPSSLGSTGRRRSPM